MNDIMLEKFFLRYGDTKEYKLKPMNNMTVYISDELNRDVIDIFNDSKYRNIAPIIKYLIDKKIIIPYVYQKSAFKSIVKHVMHTLLDPFINKNLLIHKSFYAFYTSDENKIYIAISNIENLFTYANNAWLSSIVVHELMHLSAHNINKQFLNIWGKYFHKFYYESFNYFNVNNDPIISKFCDDLSKYIIMKLGPLESDDMDKNLKIMLNVYLKDIPKLMEKNKKNISNDKFYPMIRQAIGIITKILYFAFRMNMDNLISIISDNTHTIYYNLFKSYNSLEKNNNYFKTMFYQEYYIPSEIAAILSMGNKYIKEAEMTIELLRKNL